MPPAYDEDADFDYQDEVPEFPDEAALDDYMNDEEYNLMSEVFPRAKQELVDYQGWDDLKVKLAIFDHDFDLNEAMVKLKRSLKKKKTEEALPKVSALEQLARKRASDAKKASNITPDAPAAPSRLNMLSSLRRKDDSRLPKPSLASRLASLQSRKITDSAQQASKTENSSSRILSSSVRTQPESAEIVQASQNSLMSRLSKLRNAKIQESSSLNPVANIPVKSKVKEVPKNSIAKPKSLSFEEFLLTYNVQELSENFAEKDCDLEITKVILKRDHEQTCETLRLKRKHDEVFSVYYPDTNNAAVKKQAVANFQKQSPDEVILEAQKKAFEEVEKASKGVEKITLDNSQPGNKDGEQTEETPDDDDKPFVKEPVIRTHNRATVPTMPKKPVDLHAFLSQKKPHLSFVVLGHVDAGKSTLMGRLLYDVGAVDNKLIRKLKRESELIGKSSFHLAWVMDQTTEERNRGVTVDICTSDFETKNATFTIVDAPGHRDFVPNAIAGVSQVDVAVLSIDCSTDAFESGFNLDGQTKEHTLLARSLGVRHIVVAMNKMDSVDWYEGRFMDIKSELLTFLLDVGIKEDQVSWVPCSGLSGEGVYEKEYPIGQTWYKGPSLVKCLEQVTESLHTKGYKEITEAPFVFSTLDVVQGNKNNEVILSGKVESGCIQGGETITIFPSEQSVLVDQILVGNNQTPVAAAVEGDFVSLKLRNAFYEDIQSGDLAAIVGYDIGSAQEFSAQILTFKLDRPLLPGTSFMFFRGSCEQPARIKKLISVMDKGDPTKIIKKKVRHLGSNSAALVEIELVEKKRRIPMLTIGQNKHLGRIVLRKEGKTIAGGVIKSLDL
ncbi:LANO_0H24102g1_1 [Lachancea nothofagi CBS 11611]|uniref:Elongation factor 1 alpha-like protein n=1 Tax=Lachancea nothofagi CBS 11611 TaxID=1266666 RepID=A0A1G4KNW3_9SACH|nr:LANO_0H24102g1_1 [Lachancea nothofagi CBS 11611]